MRRFIAACLLPVLGWPCPAGAEEPLLQGKPIDYWVKQLKDDDPLAREEALTVLADAGPAAAAALPALKDLLKDASPAVRLKTAIAVSKISRQEGAEASIIIEAVRGVNRADRLTALQALTQGGVPGKEAVPALAAAFDDPDEQVRRGAAAVLERMGAAAVPALVPRLADKDDVVRRQSLAVLQRLGLVGKDAIPALKEALKDSDKSFRLAAAGALLRLDPADADGVAALVAAAKDEETHQQAVEMLLGVRPRPKAAGPVFAAVIRDETDMRARLRAADALWDADHDAKEVLPVLTEAARGKDSAARRGALWTLARLGPDAKDALPDLLPVLNVNGGPYEAVDVCVAMGPAAVPALTDAARVKGPGQFSAIHKLAQMGPGGAAALLKLLKEPDEQVRAEVLKLMDDVAPDAPGVAAALTQIAKDPKDPQRLWALGGLTYIDSQRKTVVPMLLEELKEKNRAGNLAAVVGLKRMHPDADAVPILNQALQFVDRDLRTDVIVVRWQADHKTGAAVEALKSLLGDRQSDASATGEICRMAAEDSAAVPAAAEFLLNDNASVRGEALQDLRRNLSGVKAGADKVAAALKSPDVQFRGDVARVLSEAGVDAEEAVPVLAADLQSGWAPPAGLKTPLPAGTEASIAASRAAATLIALGRYGKQAASALPAVRDKLAVPIGSVRSAAAEALCQIAPEEKPAALAALREAATGGPANLGRLECAAALCRLDPGNPTAVAILRAGLSNPEPTVRLAALAVCGQAGPGAKELLPLLEQDLAQETEQARLDAATAVWKVGGDADKAAAAMADAVKDPAHLNLRTLALRRLGAMGADARSAVPALVEATRDWSRTIRSAALDAVRKVDPAAADKAGAP